MTVEIKGLGKITASGEVLNEISNLAFYASERYKEKGLYGLELKAIDISAGIFEQLNAKGYYDNL